MDPIETLMSEHRKIEGIADALDVYVSRLQDGKEAPLDDLGRFVEFIRDFADGTHHGKEEQILFEVMVREGFPKEGGPIAVMLMEHDEGRAHVKGMAEVVSAGVQPEGDALTKAVASAHGFTGLLRAHIQKEDQILYPMARSQLSPAAYAEVGERCQAFEEEHAAKKAELLALADRLCEQYR